MSEQVSPELAKLLAVVPVLPSRSIRFLSDRDAATQEMIVRQVSNILDYWEVNHVDLDPIQREFILDAIVVSLGSIAVGFQHAVAQFGNVGSGSAVCSNCPELHEDQGSG